MRPQKKDSLDDQKVRAEDILLGSLGFGEDAKILTIKKIKDGFSGEGVFSDGETFQFSSEEPLDELQAWALEFFLKSSTSIKKSY